MSKWKGEAAAASRSSRNRAGSGDGRDRKVLEERKDVAKLNRWGARNGSVAFPLWGYPAQPILVPPPPKLSAPAPPLAFCLHKAPLSSSSPGLYIHQYEQMSFCARIPSFSLSDRCLSRLLHVRFMSLHAPTRVLLGEWWRQSPARSSG